MSSRGGLLREVMLETGTTQSELSRVSGVHQPSISQFISGKVELSDEQLERCGPAEEEPFQGPVPTRMISNGEYMPLAQTTKQKYVEARVKELADKAAKKLGMAEWLEARRGDVAGAVGP